MRAGLVFHRVDTINNEVVNKPDLYLPFYFQGHFYAHCASPPAYLSDKKDKTLLHPVVLSSKLKVKVFLRLHGTSLFSRK